MIQSCQMKAVVLACSAFLVGACNEATAPAPSQPPTTTAPPTLTALPRPLTATESSIRDAANAFSFALWGTVNTAQPDSNILISPLSATFALGMTMNGASGATYDQMRSALQFGTMPLSAINGGYKSLMGLLTSLDTSLTMRVANSIWYESGLPVLPSFVDTTQSEFGATVKGLDFSSSSALTTINNWASIETNGKIPKVLDQIDPAAVMFLMNAIYFKGSWRSRFDPAQTTAATFTSNNGVQQSMQLMHQVSTLPYHETSTFQAVDLAYGNSAFTMTVLLPKAGTDVNVLAASLTPAAWTTIELGFETLDHVDLSLPKLTLTYDRELKPDLAALGMVVPFSDGADFSKMFAPPTSNGLYIGFVKHDSFVSIDEVGTEAAAVTTIGIFSSAQINPPVIRVDHPYIFAIRERFTGTVLFMGKVVSMP